MKRISVITIAILILVAGGAFAQGRGPAPGGPGAGPGPGPGMQGDFHVLAEYLGLTAEQKTAWQTIQSDLHTSIETLVSQQRTLGEQLHTALEGSDATAIGTLMLQIRAIREQIDAARASADAKFSALLNPEQKTKFAAFQAAVDFLRQHGPGPGSGPGPR